MAFEVEETREPTPPVGRVRVVLLDEDGTTEGRSSHRTVTVNDQNGEEIRRQTGKLSLAEDMTPINQSDLQSFVDTLTDLNDVERLSALVAYLQDNLRNTAESVIFPSQ